MSAVTLQSSVAKRIYLLCRSVILENLRRREFFVVLLFMGLFFVSIIVVRYLGIQNQSNVGFLLNLGLSLACILAQSVTLLSAARQFPGELEHRTIYPLLAKPVSRSEYVFSKVLASALVGWVTLLILQLMATVPIPHLVKGSSVLFGQLVILQFLGIGVVAAMGFLGSLILPHILNLIVVALIVLAGSRVTGLINSWFTMKPGHATVNWITGYVPNFTIFDLVNSYTVGAPPVVPADFLARLVLGFILIAFFLALSFFLMDRREL